MERIACYIRVSTEEQKLHGISLDAQRDKLTEYAKNNNLKIVGWYEDKGISGRKLIKNRPALQRMINDAQAHKFDRIIFIKLDRFFRSVAEYHECMKLIEPVVWTATEEKYDLTTANGRAFVNMKITIAELEADQTSERIKLVNDYKVKNGQALNGSQSQGLAYTVKRIDGVAKVVKDTDNEEMIHDIINHYLKYTNKTKTIKFIEEKYNKLIYQYQLKKLLSDRKLYGFYRGNPNYCEPYIDKATYDLIQAKLSKNIKHTPSKNVYLFTGLIKCPKCNKTLSNSYNTYGTVSLRCNNHFIYKRCDFTSIGQHSIELFLLENFNNYINVFIKKIKITDKKDTNNNLDQKIANVKLQMKNTTAAFTKCRITEVEYDKAYELLESELKALYDQNKPKEKRDLTIYENLLKNNWIALYNALTAENKQAFWRKYINQIIINENKEITDILFF